jgi:alpha-mannosidase
MSRRLAVLTLSSALFVLVVCQHAASADQPRFLWQIGVPDKSAAEFAMAPADYARFSDDPLFVVGVSEAKRDWPYIQPGPADAWAGSRPHTFTICFGLKEKPTAACQLHISLADAQNPFPPKLRVSVNGQPVFSPKTVSGGGDASLTGDLSHARWQSFVINVGPDLLKQGVNDVEIATLDGSWVLYDWIGFEAPAGVELASAPVTRVAAIDSPAVLVDRDGRLCSPIRVIIRHVGQPAEATIEATGVEPVKTALKPGSQTIELTTPAVDKETNVTVTVKSAGQTLAERQITIKPVRKWVVYLLPHSHVDIGYTQLQDDVRKKQWQNIDTALELIGKTRDYPPEARFKWNAEVLWAMDSYLRDAPAEKQTRLVDAIRAGDVELDAMYGNELTALCRPEELLRLMQWGDLLGRRCGVKVDSAMISDVPGCTWGAVSAFAQAGVKYFSIGPNFGDRIGRTMTTWTDRPFYWTGPDGKNRILCWIPYMGYALGHTGYRLDQQLPTRLAQLEQAGYPYDIVYLRWNVGGDNGHPDTGLADLVKNWNAKHAYPKMVIATTSTLFREFERRYGDKLPTFTGDWTPEWEDGAASSARETSLNRMAAERLVQAETLWSMLNPARYPADKFTAAWRNLILYDEHTWGAYNSISEPDVPFVLGQWKVKQAFALDGDAESRELLAAATAGRGKPETDRAAVDVFNTCGWPRTDLVVLSKEQSAAVGDVVLDTDGQQTPSQRLKTGQLAFLAKDVPALAGRRFSVTAGKPPTSGQASAEAAALSNSALAVRLDEASGAIVSLRSTANDTELCDAKSGVGINRYYYVIGEKVKSAKQSGAAKITVKESGPLVAALLVESDAPGCTKFSREIRVVDGLDRVEIINTLDKTAVRRKEGVHLGFAFNVPDGVMRMDIPWAVMRPEVDQLPGACKNWFTVGRWVDVSNQDYGVTWATLDAPLVEVGVMSGNLIGSQTNPNTWRAKVEPSQTLYSWVMNNHWHTNYRAEQSGPTTFRYALQPHKQYDPIGAQRFGIECSQPLVAAPARGDAPSGRPFLTLDTPEVIVASIKPSSDGRAQIVRLFGAAGKSAKATLQWADPAGKTVHLSNLAEDRLAAVNGPIEVGAWEIVTVRVEQEKSGGE